MAIPEIRITVSMDPAEVRSALLERGEVLPRERTIVVTPDSPCWGRLAPLAWESRPATDTAIVVDLTLPGRVGIVEGASEQDWGAIRSYRDGPTLRPVEHADLPSVVLSFAAPHDEIIDAAMYRLTRGAHLRAEAQAAYDTARERYGVWCEQRRLDRVAEAVAFLQGLTDAERAGVRERSSDAITGALEGRRDYLGYVRQHLETHRADERKKAQIAADVADARVWIAEYGSALLRRIVDESMLSESMARYRNERLGVERPGWIFEDEGPDKGSEHLDPRNPTEEAFELLDRARETDPAAALVRLRWPREDPDGYESDRVEHAWGASAQFLGRTIVLVGEVQ